MTREADWEAEKKRLRAVAKRVRARLSEDDRASASAAICERVRKAPFFATARVVMMYAPVFGEVDVTPLTQGLLGHEDVWVTYPKVSSSSREITPMRVGALDDLVPGAYGIPEPKDGLQAVEPTRIDVVIVPALAYDRRGYRLGYGGGYYDRFLPTLSAQAVKVGVQYDLLVWDALPVGPHDVSVDWVITERSVVEVRRA